MKKRNTVSLLVAGLLVCGVIAMAFLAHEPDGTDRAVDAQEKSAQVPQNREEEMAADTNPAIPPVPANLEGAVEEATRAASPETSSETQESAVHPTASTENSESTTRTVTESPAGAPVSGDDDLALAYAAFEKRDYTTCVQYLEPATRTENASFETHYRLGLSLRYLGRYDESNTAFDAALRIAPDHVRALVNSARTLVELGQAEEAEFRLVKAIELAPDNGDAWNVLGRAQLVRGELDDAVTSFTRACELDGSNAYAQNNLGLAHLHTGAWADAARALEKAIGIRDDVAYFHNNLGLAYERLERSADAADAFQRALALRPDHLKAQASLARVQPFVRVEEGDLASASPETLEAFTSPANE